MLDPVALAWASWLGLGIGVFGTMTSLVGLLLTFREARAAKRAASEARSEVQRVLAVIRARTRLAALSSAVAQADLLMSRMERDALRSSPESFTAFRRLMKEAFGSGAADPAASADAELIQLDQRLDEIAKLISSRLDLKVKRTKMIEVFEDIRTLLIHYEAKARTEEIV